MAISTKHCYTLSEAEDTAATVVDKLKDYCIDIMVAGSVRRKCAIVHDIEIVCIPKYVTDATLFEPDKRTIDPRFVDAVNSISPSLKGAANGKYTRRDLSGTPIDIFMCTRKNWGYITFIRTGSGS